jgi:hypothetical protein
MPIPLIAMLAAGAVSVFWPKPNLEERFSAPITQHEPGPGVFNPHMAPGVFEAPQVKAPVDLAATYTPIFGSGKEPKE